MKTILIKWFMAINASLIRITRGRIVRRLGTQTILILNTTRRKSGQPQPKQCLFFLGKYPRCRKTMGKR
ncbi:MAG: hypothetical protein IPL71_17040 [Anaerolineales bacterium]|uniref:hypothetical protein n=1 Tax=Candidatus Villigracilis proximus TaxID=3140683 RepID=UPI003135C613|nr:hypothetical protein [Anaerolineales bacterium]